MASDSNIRSFTAADIEKYHRGELSAKERHDLEKAALDDPFLADALEGYAIPGINVSADIEELKKRLAGKTESAKVIPLKTGGSSSFRWWRIAVMILLIAGAGLLSYMFLFKKAPKDYDIANLKQKKSEQVRKPDTAANTLPQPGGTESSTGLASQQSNLVNTDKTASQKEMSNEKAVTTQTNSTIVPALDSVRANLATADSQLPITSVPAKAEEEKKLGEIKVSKDDIALNDINNKGKELAKKAVDKDAAGAFKANTEPRAKAAATNGYGINNQNDALFRNTNIYRGRVTDASNNALPFANITNTRDNVGTYSDAKGNFTLVSPDSVLNVQVRSIGFQNNTMNLRNDISTNQITMLEDRSLTAKVLDTVKRNYARRSRDAAMTFEEPEPADGWDYYDSYLVNNLNVPETYDIKKNDGADAVEVSFEVNKNGEPVNIRIEKSLCEKCDKEAIRLIKEGPKWKRKAKKGKRTTVTVPFIKTD